MHIAKSVLVDALRSRAKDARADWVQRELPEHIDLTKHTGLLATLNLRLTDLVAEPEAQEPPK